MDQAYGTMQCPACGGALVGTPVVTCFHCGAVHHTVCAGARGACQRCGTAFPPHLAGGAGAVNASPAATAPAESYTCPRCQEVTTPGGATVQTCNRCGTRFTLRVGARGDSAVQPPPYDPAARRITVRSSGFLQYRMGFLDPEGVAEAGLDPVVARVPMDKAGILFPDIITVAVWRRVDVTRLVLALLLPVPITILCAVGTVAASIWWILPTLFFGAIAGVMLYGALGAKRTMARVTGPNRTVTVRFDRPLWRRQRFHDELIRRAGLPPGPIP